MIKARQMYLRDLLPLELLCDLHQYDFRNKFRHNIINYFSRFQTMIFPPWDEQVVSTNPPVSVRIFKTSVGYRLGFRLTCLPAKSGWQLSVTLPSQTTTLLCSRLNPILSTIKLNSFGCLVASMSRPITSHLIMPGSPRTHTNMTSEKHTLDQR